QGPETRGLRTAPQDLDRQGPEVRTAPAGGGERVTGPGRRRSPPSELKVEPERRLPNETRVVYHHATSGAAPRGHARLTRRGRFRDGASGARPRGAGRCPRRGVGGSSAHAG